MGKIIPGDDGLPAEEVGPQAEEKHEYLRRYVDISKGARAGWVGPTKAGATYIDPFCGPGRCYLKDTGKWIDGGVVAAWKKSVEGGAPFTMLYLGDLNTELRAAAVERLIRLNAPVSVIDGPASSSIPELVPKLGKYGLHFAFLDPFNLETLGFPIFEALSTLKRIDILVHVSQMDLQRNLATNISEESAFDIFAPGWRDAVNVNQSQQPLRQAVFAYWRDKIAKLGIGTATEMKLIRGAGNQPLYWLLLAAKHELAHKFWNIASNPTGQGSFGF